MRDLPSLHQRSDIHHNMHARHHFPHDRLIIDVSFLAPCNSRQGLGIYAGEPKARVRTLSRRHHSGPPDTVHVLCRSKHQKSRGATGICSQANNSTRDWPITPDAGQHYEVHPPTLHKARRSPVHLCPLRASTSLSVCLSVCLSKKTLPIGHTES